MVEFGSFVANEQVKEEIQGVLAQNFFLLAKLWKGVGRFRRMMDIAQNFDQSIRLIMDSSVRLSKLVFDGLNEIILASSEELLKEAVGPGYAELSAARGAAHEVHAECGAVPRSTGQDGLYALQPYYRPR